MPLPPLPRNLSPATYHDAVGTAGVDLVFLNQIPDPLQRDAGSPVAFVAIPDEVLEQRVLVTGDLDAMAPALRHPGVLDRVAVAGHEHTDVAVALRRAVVESIAVAEEQVTDPVVLGISIPQVAAVALHPPAQDPQHHLPEGSPQRAAP